MPNKMTNNLKSAIVSIIIIGLFCLPLKVHAGFFSDGLKNALQFVKSIIISPNDNDKTDNREPNNKPFEPQTAKDEIYIPQPPTPWSDLFNIIGLINKEQERLKSEFVPQKFLDRQETIIKPTNKFLDLDLTTTTDAIMIFFNITPEEFKEWQMRQEIIQLLNKEVNWYDQKLKEGLKMTDRKKVDNLITSIKNHRKEFKKANIEPARITILINGADDALKMARNRNIIIKNSISNIKNESDRKTAEKLYLTSQDKINLASIKIRHLKNNRDLTLEITEPIILEINSLIKSMYEDFQLISEML